MDKKINVAIQVLPRSANVGTYELVDKAIEAMNSAWQAASQDIYSAQQNTGGPEAGPQDFNNAGSNGNGNSTADDVTDVEFEEVSGDKK